MLPGRRCVAATRFHHRFRGGLDTSNGALELRWDDGAVTSFDVASDWTLRIVDGPWPDPYAGLDDERLRETEADVGVFVAVPAALDVVGRVLLATAPERNEIGELTGVRLTFENAGLRVHGWAGDLRVEPL